MPLTLYIHFPWCLRKCPYCDFNSYPWQSDIRDEDYLSALLADLNNDLASVNGREVKSIFLGGGTPSIFSPQLVAKLLSEIKKMLPLAVEAEITMEANPGTINLEQLQLLNLAGINRLSIGVQSFQDEKLNILGRIHNAQQAQDAINVARLAGFNNINIDLMYGLPDQKVADALFDLDTALQLKPTHLSWYQLTLAAGTKFYQTPPSNLPEEDLLGDIQNAGEQFISACGFEQYEVANYARNNKKCSHNLNYWLFGDYIGIGAGAHGKITQIDKDGIYQIRRTIKTAEPKEYIFGAQLKESAIVSKDDLVTEFMLNALRLLQPIPFALFKERTGQEQEAIEKKLLLAATKGLIEFNELEFTVTKLGHRFLNQLLLMF